MWEREEVQAVLRGSKRRIGRAVMATVRERNATLSKQRRFLKAYAECGIVSRSAEAAKIDRCNHYRWLADPDDPDYANAFTLADEMAINNLEDEARFRAIEGLRKYKFDRGLPVYVACDKSHPEAVKFKDEDGKISFARHYYEHDRSDTLLLALLNAAHPERFGRYRHDHSGKVDVNHSGNVQVYIPENSRNGSAAPSPPPPPQREAAIAGTNGNGNGKHA